MTEKSEIFMERRIQTIRKRMELKGDDLNEEFQKAGFNYPRLDDIEAARMLLKNIDYILQLVAGEVNMVELEYYPIFTPGSRRMTLSIEDSGQVRMTEGEN